MRLVHDEGGAGAFVFSWADEWFKRTWNTQESQVAERRQLWHDPLTNEQWFGLLATDSGEVPDGARELTPDSGSLEYLLAKADASYLHLDVVGREGTPQDVDLGVDVLPGGGPEYRVVVDTTAGTASAFVRRDLDPLRLYTRERLDLPDEGEHWHLFRQMMNRSYDVAGEHHDAELGDVGDLLAGSWDPDDPDYDSRSTWSVDDANRTIHLRLPWPMLGLADPSSRTALGPGRPARMVPVDGLRLELRVDGSRAGLDYTWPAWNHVGSTERLKAGVGAVAEAFGELGR
jgi:hypothetical protein